MFAISLFLIYFSNSFANVGNSLKGLGLLKIFLCVYFLVNDDFDRHLERGLLSSSAEVSVAILSNGEDDRFILMHMFSFCKDVRLLTSLLYYGVGNIYLFSFG